MKLIKPASGAKFDYLWSQMRQTMPVGFGQDAPTRGMDNFISIIAPSMHLGLLGQSFLATLARSGYFTNATILRALTRFICSWETLKLTLKTWRLRAAGMVAQMHRTLGLAHASVPSAPLVEKAGMQKGTGDETYS